MAETRSSKPAVIQNTSQNSTDSTNSSSTEIYDSVHIYDPIHGYIEIPPRIKQIIDTKEVQRLRYLKQLGASYFVFPGASHNRFEHSIGVMHLSNLLLKQLNNKQNLSISDDIIFCVSAAGLLHDIGHGPFSHVFDNEFMYSTMNSKFRHEDMSVKICKDLFKNNNIHIDDEHLLLIQALVSPSTHESVVRKYQEMNQGFLFEIVANELTGIDVDKWDYFLRDSRCIGIGNSFRYDRLLEHARVIDDHICWQEKTSFELYTMFRTRYELYKTVYSHKAGKAIEYMICDIFTYANEYFDIIGKTKDSERYLELTDHILTRIEYEPIVEGKKGIQGLLKAKALIDRLRNRKLYSCCGYLLLTPDIVAAFNPTKNEHEAFSTPPKDENEKKCHPKIEYKLIEEKWSLSLYEMIQKQHIQKQQNHNKENKDTRDPLKPLDIKIQLMSLSFGMETQHPMERAFLYNSKNPNVCKHVHVDQITTIAGTFREVIVRAYVKKSEWKVECERGFKRFVKLKGLVQDEDYDDEHGASLFVSPKQSNRKQEKKKLSISKSRKRKLEFPTSSSATQSVDLMDTTQRNKKARHK